MSFVNKPLTDIMDCVRASTATYVDATGKIRTAGVNEPRIDFSSGQGRLLVEEQRTNFLGNSQSAWGGAWFGGGSAYFNEEVSDGDIPYLGDTNVSFYGPTAGTNSFSTSVSFQNVTGLSAGVYTLSCLLKSRDPNDIISSPTIRSLHRGVNGSSGSSGSMVFRIHATGGVWGSFSSGVGSGIFGESKLIECTPIGNGWFRYVERFELIQSGDVQIRLFPYSGGGTFTGDGESGVLRTLMQLEKGSTPSSYIPTGGSSAVTRAADNVSRVLGDEYNSSEGSVVTECQFNRSLSVGSHFLIDISDGGNADANRLQITRTGGDIFLRYNLSLSGTQIYETNVAQVNSGVNYKIAYKFKSGEQKVFLNGELVFTGNHGSLPVFSNPNMSLNGRAVNFAIPLSSVNYRAINYYSKALSDIECEELTRI